MEHDIQKASMWKRISAGIFDWILTGILAVGVAFLFSVVLNYDGCAQAVEDAYARYGQQYGVDFSISAEDYAALTPEVLARYDEAAKAMNSDADAVRAYSLLTNLMLLLPLLGCLAAIMLMELLVPLLLGNGMTLGKKIFGLCLIRTDAVKLTALQLFARTVLGKFAIETMVPIYAVILFFTGSQLALAGIVVVPGLLIAQVLSLILSRTNSMLHDLLAGTTVADFASQRIFTTAEELLAYQKQIAAERSARQSY